MRRGAIVQLVLIAAAAGGVATAVGVLFDWLPVQATDEAARIHFVFWFVTWICIAIFALVAGVSIYSVLNFRAHPDDEEDGPPIHGHTGLEIVWTAVPTVLVTAIAIVSAVVLARNGEAGSNPLRVDVLAQQFAWSFSYPQADGITSGNLRLPLGRKVKLHIQARDVIHSFWVPEFSQKQDALPGEETTLVITPNRLGTFPVICTELCGLGHAVMRTRAIVMPADDFDAWVREQRRARQAGPGEAGLAVFRANGCAACHELAAAQATGMVGPSLENLAADAREHGEGDPEAFVRESIVDPNAFVHEGYSENVMPAFDQLPQDQLDALVKFLLEAGGEGR